MKKTRKVISLVCILSMISLVFLSCSQPTSDTTPEAKPTIKAPKLSATLEQNSIKLTITSQNECSTHNYKIYRSSQNNISTKELTQSLNDKTVEYIYNDNSLTQNGYYYYWASEIVDGIETELSPSVSVYFEYISEVTISKPTSLKVTCENETISVSWNAPSTGVADYYSIYMNSGNGYYTCIKTVSGTSAVLTYKDNPEGSDILISSGKKTIAVTANTSEGVESAFSESITFDYEYNSIALSAPQNLTAVIDSEDSDAYLLKWDAVNNAVSYTVYLYGSNYSYGSRDDYCWSQKLADCSSNYYSLKNSELSYTYSSVAVVAVDSHENESEKSDFLDLFIGGPIISEVSFDKGIITVNWDKPQHGKAVRYNLYVADEKSDFVKVKTLDKDVKSASVSYKDTPGIDGILSSDGKKYIALTAENSIKMESSFAKTTAKTVDNYSVIPVIKEIDCSLDDSQSLVTLNWKQPEYGDSVEYDIFIRGATGSSALEDYKYIKTVTSPSATLSSNDITEDNTILDSNQTYLYFTIKAKNAVGICSPYPTYNKTENPCKVHSYLAHPAPTNLKFEFNDDKKFVLTWDKVGNAAYYKLYYNSAQYEDYSQSKIVNNSWVFNKDVFDYAERDRTSGKVTFLVRAVDSNGKESPVSSPSGSIGKGAFDIKDFTDQELSYSKLSSDHIYNNEIKYYCYNVIAGKNYQIAWTSSGDEPKSSNSSAAISVTGYYSSELQNPITKDNSIVYNQNYGYKTPVNFTAAKDDNIIIEVTNRSYSSNNTFSIYDIGVYPVTED